MKPPEIRCTCESTRLQVIELVIVKLEGKQVDHGREDALWKTGDLVTIQVEIRKFSEVLESTWFDGADVIVRQVEVEKLIQSFESLFGDLTNLTVLQVQRNEPLHFAKAPGWKVSYVVALEVEQTGGLGDAGDFLQTDAVADDVLQITVTVALARALSWCKRHEGYRNL